jgi:hypothetical protein
VSGGVGLDVDPGEEELAVERGKAGRRRGGIYLGGGIEKQELEKIDVLFYSCLYGGRGVLSAFSILYSRMLWEEKAFVFDWKSICLIETELLKI